METSEQDSHNWLIGTPQKKEEAREEEKRVKRVPCRQSEHLSRNTLARKGVGEGRRSRYRRWMRRKGEESRAREGLWRRSHMYIFFFHSLGPHNSCTHVVYT